MRRNMLMLLFVVAALLPGLSAGAYAFDGIDANVEYWAGSGSNEALCVVDFGAASYSFGYRWDTGVPTGFSMIQAIADEGALDLDIGSFSYGKYVNGITYGSDSYIGCGDGYDDWWHYWISDDGSNWQQPWTYGAAGRNLSNGCWDAWSYGSAAAPDVPTVPEPTCVFALTSLFGLAASRRLLRRSGK
ncbi:MAG: hypothetical protein ABFD49_08345 [Armatimonadota bacterium]|nr:hypothetical protein [bacterium]